MQVLIQEYREWEQRPAGLSERLLEESPDSQDYPLLKRQNHRLPIIRLFKYPYYLMFIHRN